MTQLFNKNPVIKISLCFLALISLTACLLCYWQLDRIPYGFHVDELSTAVDVGCMTTEGVDAHNLRYPIFSNLNYGTPKPATYIYPAILWAKAFGYSVPSLRAYSVTSFVLAVLGLFFLARQLFGWRYAFLTMTIASISPWTLVLARTAFESLFAMTFMIWGLYFFLRPPKVWSTLLAGLFFSAAMYSYPPFRLQTPLMVLSLIIYSYWIFPRTRRLWTVFFLSLIVPSIPLILKILSGELQERFNSISIFSKNYLNSIHSSGSLKELVEIFFYNYAVHFRPDFLFLTGDPYLIHSTEHFGILSWVDMAALGAGLVFIVMLFFKRSRQNNPLILQKNYLLLIVANILIGVIPSALTTDLPNSLRITCAWPFVCLLSGYLLWQACERWWWMWVLSCILSALFAMALFKVYFQVYPQESKGMYGFWTLEQARQCKTDEDWLKFLLLYRHEDYTSRYFLMQYRGMSCTQSRTVWEGMRDYLKSKGSY